MLYLTFHNFMYTFRRLKNKIIFWPFFLWQNYKLKRNYVLSIISFNGKKWPNVMMKCQVDDPTEPQGNASLYFIPLPLTLNDAYGVDGSLTIYQSNLSHSHVWDQFDHRQEIFSEFSNIRGNLIAKYKFHYLASRHFYTTINLIVAYYFIGSKEPHVAKDGKPVKHIFNTPEIHIFIGWVTDNRFKHWETDYISITDIKCISHGKIWNPCRHFLSPSLNIYFFNYQLKLDNLIWLASYIYMPAILHCLFLFLYL